MKELINRLHTQTFVLDLDTPVKQLPPLPDFHYKQIDESTIEFDVSRGQTMNDLFALLSQHSIRVSSLRNKSNRLEELFIHLVTENRAQ